MRAQQLPEPHRSHMRDLLRDYVDVRVRATLGQEPMPSALVRVEALQDQLWSGAGALAQETPAIPTAAAFGGALIQMVEVHAKRVAAGLHNNIPATIWVALFCVTALAMAITGYRAGIAGRRNIAATAVLVLAFSAVFQLIANLDRPQEGFLTVSQLPMLDLQTRLHRP
jgi:hypothetical protein